MPDLNVEEQALSEELNPTVSTEQAPASDKPSGTPPAQPTDDPEFDLGTDEKGQPLKFKKSQILEFHKGNMLNSDYTKKTQEIAAQKAELKEMFDIVEHLKANPKKAERIIAILDEKEEAAQEKVDEIDEALKQLDPNDPGAKALRALKAKTEQLLKNNQELQTKLGSFEQKTKSIEEQEATKQATTVLTTALDNVSKELKFEDDDDKADWRNMVLTHLVNNPKKYASEEEFLTTINEVSQKEHERLTKQIERHTSRYIKSKGGPTVPAHPAGTGAKPLTKKPDMENLQDILEEALSAEEKTNKE